MRIKDHEYQDIIKALKKHELGIDEFDFVKKKGWFHLIKKDSARFFSFHRKVEVEIKDGNFVESLKYRFKTDEKSGESESWAKTKMLLTHWIRSLEK